MGVKEEVMKIVVGKLKESLIAMENIGGDAFTWFNKMGPKKIVMEKLKEALIVMENIGGHAFVCFRKILHWLPVDRPFLIIAVILSVIFYFSKGGGGGGGSGKMMKAPGRNCKMPRRVFEDNPKGYFRDLRS